MHYQPNGIVHQLVLAEGLVAALVPHNPQPKAHRPLQVPLKDRRCLVWCGILAGLCSLICFIHHTTGTSLIWADTFLPFFAPFKKWGLCQGQRAKPSPRCELQHCIRYCRHKIYSPARVEAVQVVEPTPHSRPIGMLWNDIQEECLPERTSSKARRVLQARLGLWLPPTDSSRTVQQLGADRRPGRRTIWRGTSRSNAQGSPFSAWPS